MEPLAYYYSHIMENPLAISDSLLPKTDWFHWKDFVSKHEIICFRKSRKRNPKCENNIYESPSCEENYSDSENDGRGPRVTVNNLHLTININVEAADQRDNNSDNKQFVLSEENSTKLLNIVDNVLTQNCKS